MSEHLPVVEDLNILSEKLTNGDIPPSNNYSVETLAFLINKNRVSSLENRMRTEFKELKQRQGEVKYLHQLLRSINTLTDAKGNFDYSNNPELKAMFDEAVKMGVEIDLQKVKYTREERERLIDNIKMMCEDLNVQNEMQLQTITRLTNERYESFQMARSIMKPLHDDKVNKARAMGGR